MASLHGTQRGTRGACTGLTARPGWLRPQQLPADAELAEESCGWMGVGVGVGGRARWGVRRWVGRRQGGRVLLLPTACHSVLPRPSQPVYFCTQPPASLHPLPHFPIPSPTLWGLSVVPRHKGTAQPPADPLLCRPVLLVALCRLAAPSPAAPPPLLLAGVLLALGEHFSREAPAKAVGGQSCVCQAGSCVVGRAEHGPCVGAAVPAWRVRAGPVAASSSPAELKSKAASGGAQHQTSFQSTVPTRYSRTATAQCAVALIQPGAGSREQGSSAQWAVAHLPLTWQT